MSRYRGNGGRKRSRSDLRAVSRTGNADPAGRPEHKDREEMAQLLNPQASWQCKLRSDYRRQQRQRGLTVAQLNDLLPRTRPKKEDDG